MFQKGGIHMKNEEIKKYLHELIEELPDDKIMKIYQLIRGIFGKAV